MMKFPNAVQCVITHTHTHARAKLPKSQAPPTVVAAMLHHCSYIRVRHHSSPGTPDRLPNKSTTLKLFSGLSQHLLWPSSLS